LGSVASLEPSVAEEIGNVMSEDDAVTAAEMLARELK
jgi:hypothetical protein